MQTTDPEGFVLGKQTGHFHCIGIELDVRDRVQGALVISNPTEDREHQLPLVHLSPLYN